MIDKINTSTLYAACAAIIILLGVANAHAGSTAQRNFEGTWRSLDSDNRKFTIESVREGWEMSAPDLHCDFGMDDLKDNQKDLGVIEANIHFTCADEGSRANGFGQIKLFNIGNLLAIAQVATDRSDDLNQEELEKLQQPVTFVYLYQRISKPTAATDRHCAPPKQPPGTGNSLSTWPIPEDCPLTKEQRRTKAWCQTLPTDKRPRACGPYGLF